MRSIYIETDQAPSLCKSIIYKSEIITNATPTAMASAHLDDDEANWRSAAIKTHDIYSRALKCKDLFEKYSMLSTPYSERMSVCQKSFLTWVSCTNAFGQSVYLDYRLQFKPEMRGLLVAMFQILIENLQRSK